MEENPLLEGLKSYGAQIITVRCYKNCVRPSLVELAIEMN